MNFLRGSWLWESVLTSVKKGTPVVTGGAYLTSLAVNTLFFPVFNRVN